MGVYPGEGSVKFCQQVLAGDIWQRPHLRPHHRAKLGQHLGIQFIGLASLPVARAKSRTRLGLTTATGRPATPKTAVSDISNPPVASTTTTVGPKSASSSARPVTHGGLYSTCLPLGYNDTSRTDLDTSMPTDGSSHSITPPYFCSPCTGPSLQMRATTPKQLFGLSQGRNVTTLLSNGLL